MAIAHPADASACAIPRPMPRPAPVMSATRPVKLKSGASIEGDMLAAFGPACTGAYDPPARARTDRATRADRASCLARCCDGVIPRELFHPRDLGVERCS